jgi:dipeptidyl aminopeptidase/acylaminoacyl peptidase
MLRRIAVVASALTGIPLALAWLISQRVLHPPARSEDHGLEDFGLVAEAVRFSSRDGTLLSGWFVPPTRSPAPAVVLTHGWRRSHAELSPHAALLHRAGFAALVYDQRHRGDSDGAAITMGLREQEDLLAAVDLLCARPEVDAGRLAAFGMSMGGVVTILVAAQDARVRAVAVEAPYPEADTVVTRALRHYTKLPTFPIGPLTRWVLEWRLGERLDSVQAIDAVAQIAPRPLFVIADELDAVIGADETERVYRAAGEPKEFWLVPGAQHACAWQTAPEEYERRLAGFFTRALGEGAAVPAREESA